MQYESEAFLQQSAQTFALRRHDDWNGYGDFGIGHWERCPADSGAERGCL
jgi:hypothetical protein